MNPRTPVVLLFLASGASGCVLQSRYDSLESASKLDKAELSQVSAERDRLKREWAVLSARVQEREVRISELGMKSHNSETALEQERRLGAALRQELTRLSTELDRARGETTSLARARDDLTRRLVSLEQSERQVSADYARRSLLSSRLSRVLSADQATVARDRGLLVIRLDQSFVFPTVSGQKVAVRAERALIEIGKVLTETSPSATVEVRMVVAETTMGDAPAVGRSSGRALEVARALIRGGMARESVRRISTQAMSASDGTAHANRPAVEILISESASGDTTVRAPGVQAGQVAAR